MRKYLRLAPAYYSMWMIVWAFTSRLSQGPMWHNTDNNTRTCEDQWMSTLFMLGNLFPKEMEPYSGCYQQAWPLQLDIQIAFFVPLFAIICWKSPVMGTLMSFGLIVANVFINMHYSMKYDLTIGLIDVNNYYLLQSIISKPWTKLQNVGHGALLAMWYTRVLKYREIKCKTEKKEKYGIIHFMLGAKWISCCLFSFGMIIILLNLTTTSAFNQ